MMSVRLLHLDSSAHRAAESVSRRLTDLFARTWRAGNDRAEYHHRDLVADPVPPIGPAYCALGRRVEQHGVPAPVRYDELIETEDERREWDLTRALVDEVRGSDVLLLGAPMYNFAVPAALKAWIDRITFPGVFTGADGSSSLADLRVVVVTSRGGAYGPGSGAEDLDFLAPYLRSWLTKQGVAARNIEIVVADRTLAEIVPGYEQARPAAARSLAAAHERLGVLAGALPVPT